MALLHLLFLIGGIREAGATTAAFDRCFDGEAAFVCGPAESAWCGVGEAGSLDPLEPLPVVQLERSPFLQQGPGMDAADRDGDTLDDRMELRLAEAFAPYVVNAWDMSYWDGDPALGEPTALFQVRPLTAPLIAPLVFRPRARAILIRYVLLWDYDWGWRAAPSCEDDPALACSGQHCGDNQDVLLTVVMEPSLGPTVWRPRADDTVPTVRWWRRGAVGPGGVGVSTLNPVIFLSAGKHHFAPGPCTDCNLGGLCDENVWCPRFVGDPAARARWRRSVGQHQVTVDGSAALAYFELRGLSHRYAYPWFDPPLGNNVGEPTAHDPAWFVDALDEFCLYEQAYASDLSPGLVRCFTGESAWDTTNFAGGMPDCDGACTHPNATIWATGDLSDLDGDGLPNTADECYLLHDRWYEFDFFEPVDGTVDRDLDGVMDECDNCPDDPNEHQQDSDGDTLGNACDGCPNRATVAFGPAEGPNADGDVYLDVCDWCPRTPAAAGDDAWLDDMDLNDGSSVDADGDTVGWHCDNCRTEPNPDQVNCNELEERLRHAEAGLDPVGFVGTGDACDATPCVAECRRLFDPRTGVSLWTDLTECESRETADCLPAPNPYGDREICTYDCWDGEPATIAVCPVGFSDAERPLGEDPEQGHDTSRKDGTLSVATEFRGCQCTPEESAEGSCGSSLCARDGLYPAGRWNDATYRGYVAGLWPVLPYRRTYQYTPAGTTQAHSSLDSRYQPSLAPYRWWYVEEAPDRVVSRSWNYLTDGVGSGFPRDAERDAWVWFKPQPGPGYSGFGDARQYGNSYVGRRMGDELRRLRPWVPPLEEYRPLPGPGQRLLDRFDFRFGIDLPPMRKVDRPRPIAGILDGDCVNCDGLLFDEPGDVAAGLVVATWDQTRRRFVEVLGTRVAQGEFDVAASAIAFGWDASGQVSRFWLVGGRDAMGHASNGLWSGRRRTVAVDDGPANDRFVLTQIEPIEGTAWPPARWGAALAVRGNVTNGQFLEDLATAGADSTMMPSDGSEARPAADGLLLVGGRDEQALHGDVWIYDGRWRAAGPLPEVEGGLADAAGAVTTDALWLFGGRQATGPSGDLWRIDLETGAAERRSVDGIRPAPRERAAMTIDSTTGELLVFGGVTSDGPVSDIWAFDPGASTWRVVASPCSGNGCPAAHGNDMLLPGTAPGEVDLVADPWGPAAWTPAWRLSSGVWTTTAESPGVPGRDDCDGDTAPDPGWDARCGAGGDGFPWYGRRRCDAGGALSCRVPAAPAQVLAEFRVAGDGPALPWERGVAVLHRRSADLYLLEAGGMLRSHSSLRFARPTEDLVFLPGYALAADTDGLTSYRLADGRAVATLRSCGKARRLFVRDGRAYVLGLRSLLVVNVLDPERPSVLAEWRIGAVLGDAWLAPAGRCSSFYTALDLVCDLTGACPWTGRVAAAEEGHRLFLNLLDSTYVMDLTGGWLPELSEPLRTGLVRDLRFEAPFLYLRLLSGVRPTYEELPGEGWVWASAHDVPAWVDGVAQASGFVVRRTPGRLIVAEAQ